MFTHAKRSKRQMNNKSEDSGFLLFPCHVETKHPSIKTIDNSIVCEMLSQSTQILHWFYRETLARRTNITDSVERATERSSSPCQSAHIWNWFWHSGAWKNLEIWQWFLEKARERDFVRICTMCLGRVPK